VTDGCEQAAGWCIERRGPRSTLHETNAVCSGGRSSLSRLSVPLTASCRIRPEWASAIVVGCVT